MKMRDWVDTFTKDFDKQLSDLTNDTVVGVYGCKILGGNDKLYFFDDMWDIRPSIGDYVIVENRDDIALAKVIVYAEMPQNQVRALTTLPLSAMKRVVSIFDKEKLYKKLKLRTHEVSLDDILEEE